MEMFIEPGAGSAVVADLAAAVDAKRSELSALDGAVGDGDHGVNMAKGFGIARELLADRTESLPEALSVLGSSLMDHIGGSMGPLYGSMFLGMGGAAARDTLIDRIAFGKMLDRGLDALTMISDAKLGDKTLLDVLIPSIGIYRSALTSGASFQIALTNMAEEARSSWERSHELVARLGRAARLGERTRGQPDPGATSCKLILETLSSTLRRRMVTDLAHEAQVGAHDAP